MRELVIAGQKLQNRMLLEKNVPEVGGWSILGNQASAPPVSYSCWKKEITVVREIHWLPGSSGIPLATKKSLENVAMFLKTN